MSLDPNTPVLVGVGVIQQRCENPLQAKEAIALMIAAAERAAADAGSRVLLSRADCIQIPQGLWKYSDPARLLGRAIGADQAKTVLADFGILQQSLMTHACEAIQGGSQKIAIVAGGEAKYRSLCAGKQGVELTDTEQIDEQPDTYLKPAAELMSDIELAHGLLMPVEFYAFMENAMRYADGHSITQHRDELAALYARFSHIAAANPDAWQQQTYSAAEIRDPGPQNRMLAFPYTKLMNTQWNVDQACALLFCSVSVAKELNIARDKWVFPLSSAESEHMTIMSERAELQRSPGAALAGEKALQLAHATVEDLNFLELYSCFPAAVKVYARELGIVLDKDLVVTGSMAFAGGPLNNFVLQSTAKMADTLRRHPGAKGMVTSVSGLLTKQAFALWSSEANADGFQCADVSTAAAESTKLLPLLESYSGPASIASYTVKYDAGQPSTLIAVCNTADGKRALASSKDANLAHEATEREFCGRAVSIDKDANLQLI
ncbi:MAG: hypothetical protein ACR2P1_21485 [Pseudomonadales bacterium]